MVYRMFRSAVTMSILACAVAFLAHMLIYGITSARTQQRAAGELQEVRDHGRVIQRLIRPDSGPTIIENFAEGNDRYIREYQAWTEMDSRETGQVREAAQRFRQFRDYIEGLNPENQSVLTSGLSSLELIDRLQTQEYMKLFVNRLDSLDLRSPLGNVAELREFIKDDWAHLSEAVEKVRKGHSEAVEQVQSQYPDREVRSLFHRPPEGFLQKLQETGFITRDLDLEAIGVFARQAADRNVLHSAISSSRIKAAIARKLDIDPLDVTLIKILREVADNKSRAQWFSKTLKETGGVDKVLSASRIQHTAQAYLHTKKLEDIAGSFAETDSEDRGFFGLSVRLQWLILLAFIVCVVGVANAMLMSVTERFSEIATMKCLGAMDSFVMLMFVFEAALQGIIGGIIGLALGAGLSFVRGFFEYGTMFITSMDAGLQLTVAALLSLAIGVILATIAALGPSLYAARLAPMEAMRVE